MASIKTHAKRWSFTASILVMLLLPLLPVSVRAEPPGNHMSIKLTATPSQPVAGEDTRLTVNVMDAGQQSVASASVLISAEKVTASSASGHAGMNMGGSQTAAATIRTTAKASDHKGEYVATFRLPEEGQWKIMATAGDTTAHFELDVVSHGSVQGNRTPVGDSHSEVSDTSAPSYWFVGSVVGIVLVTVALVPILRRRDVGSPGVEAG